MFLNFYRRRIRIPSVRALAGKEKLELVKVKTNPGLKIKQSSKKLVKRIENKKYNRKLHYYK